MISPNTFKAGDWIILKKEIRKKSNYPLKVVFVDDEHVLIALWGSGKGSINPSIYELATESEIKKEKLKNMF